MSIALNPAAPAQVTDAALEQIVNIVLTLIGYDPPVSHFTRNEGCW